MREPKLTARSGELVLGSLEAPFVRVLQDLPGFLRLAREHPRARARLLPSAYDDDESNSEWRRHAGPEITHLFESAASLVTKDLAGLEKESFSRTYHLRIPSGHHNAWMSSLNAARLALAEIHRIQEADMENEHAFDPGSERDAAILSIRLLGWLEELLVLAA